MPARNRLDWKSPRSQIRDLGHPQFDVELHDHTVTRLVSAVQFGEQAQDLKVEPDQGYHDAESAVPLHVFGSAVLNAAFDEVEVEDQVESGDGYYEQAEADADNAGAIDGDESNPEEAEHHLREVKETDAASGRDNPHPQSLSHLDKSGAISKEHGEEGAECEADGLYCNAGIAKVEGRRDAAEKQAFEQRVDGRGDWGPLFFEDGDHGEDKTAKDADEHEGRHTGEVAGLKEEMPGPGRGGDGAKEQNAGLVDGAVDGHAVGEVGDASVTGALQVAEGVFAECGIGRFHQWHVILQVLQVRAVFRTGGGSVICAPDSILDLSRGDVGLSRTTCPVVYFRDWVDNGEFALNCLRPA